jgi:hypothetical protein
MSLSVSCSDNPGGIQVTAKRDWRYNEKERAEAVVFFTLSRHVPVRQAMVEPAR